MVKQLGRMMDLVMALMSEKRKASRIIHYLVQMMAHCLVRKMVPRVIHYLVRITAHCLVPKKVPRMVTTWFG